MTTLTPEKKESKKRPNIGMHLNKTPQKKPKKHKPKILDESIKKKTPNSQGSGFTPKTPMKRSTHMQHSRSCVKKNISKKASVKKNKFERDFDSSKDVVQGHVPNSSCKRALTFLEKETRVENVGNLSEVYDGQLPNLKLNKKEEKQFVKHYQRRVSVKRGDSVVHMPSISETQDAQPSSHVVCGIYETDCLTSLRSSCNNISSFPKSYKRRRNVRHLLCRRHDETTMNVCVKSLPSYPLEWRKKRSSGCTKRRIYDSRPIKFICSSSPLIDLLEHLVDEKHQDKLAKKKKEMRKGRNKIEPPPKNEIVKMIGEDLPQECLLQKKDLNVPSKHLTFYLNIFTHTHRYIYA